ncbi:MAG: nicotinate-nucleotide--dimethylbenzimidazole phosphoribosyltransferase [Candidatus Omnitrophica bacterium]|nr:nicotinate-nucleotide--dimethylbenzimidazole phosphoribosyltransferase [Candidatus Omnitrophota bacterium]
MEKLRETIGKIESVDGTFEEKTQNRLDSLTKPQGSLGRLEELAKQIVEITGNEMPKLDRKVIFTLAGDHGVASSGVSAYPKEVTPQMVYNFLAGGAGINVLAKHVGAEVVVADLGVACDLKAHPDLIIKKVNYGTKNIAEGAAMTKEEAVKSIENGIGVFEEKFRALGGIDIAGTGEMGIANTTPSSAIVSVITGKEVNMVTGRGTGIDDARLQLKIKTIEKAIQINKPDPDDALDVLSKIGGFEIGGLVGIILAASSLRVPIVIDGFISSAAALVAYKLEPKTRDYMISAHFSVERGHAAIFDYLGLKPLLDLNLRLGEGTGAALAIGVAEAAVKILTQMATFDDAGVSKKQN